MLINAIYTKSNASVYHPVPKFQDQQGSQKTSYEP